MGDDAEQDGPAGSEHYCIVARQLFVGDENRENDCGEAARTEPAYEQRVCRARARADKRVFGRLTANFGWWVNRKDRFGRSLFF